MKQNFWLQLKQLIIDKQLFFLVSVAALLFITGTFAAKKLLSTEKGFVSNSLNSISNREPQFHAEFSTAKAVSKNVPAELIFTVKNEVGKRIRYLQFVHEKPLHLIVVSDDLSEFYHIHPEWQPDDSYAASHTFPFGGKYLLFADYTPPGSRQIIERFELNVAGKLRSPEKLREDKNLTKSVDGLQVQISIEKPLRVGEEIEIKFILKDEKTGQPVTDLQFYLAALAHLIVIGSDSQDFIHLHPLEPDELQSFSDNSTTHVHDAAELERKLIGPSPSEIVARTAFPRSGLYKLWAQFQRNNQVITVPFVLSVAENDAEKQVQPQPLFPADAIPITITQNGYEPTTIEVAENQKIKLAFYRKDAENCGGTVLFPELNIKQELPVAQVVSVELPPQAKKTLFFTCGMGMYKGAIVIN